MVIASVDEETESIMQKIIEEEFAEQMVISVVHRLRFIAEFDLVALMKEGELIEFESPVRLLERDSEFKKLYLALQKEIL